MTIAPNRAPETLWTDLRALAADPATAWSCGSFGALAEFSRDPDEPRDIAADGVALATARGALRLELSPLVRAVAYELPSRDADCWQQAISLCLPEDDCGMGRRSVLTELGPDGDAPRDADREAVLFDLGLEVRQADICVRTADPALLARLRAGAGSRLLDADNPLLREIAAASPHRVMRCRFGRIEVYQPIPPPDGESPDGPHTHVLPRLLALGRTHAATTPIPEGWIPCMTVYPASPFGDGTMPFDRTRHDDFQRLYRSYAEPRLVALKQRVFDWLAAAARPPSDPLSGFDRDERTLIRVALRQWRRLHGASATSRAWQLVFDAQASDGH